MDNKINILVIGDSIVYGMGDNEKCGWVNRLRLKLEKDTTHFYDVYNLGIPDDTSLNIVDRVYNEIKDRYYDGRLIVIFSFGGNDCIQVEETPMEFKKNIQYAIKMAKRFTDEIKFIGITEMKEVDGIGRFGRKLHVDKTKISVFDKIINKVCSVEKIDYIRIDKKVIDNSLDGIHPDEKGHQLICDIVYNNIKENSNENNNTTRTENKEE